MEKWLSGEARLEGYEKFRFKLERLLRKDEAKGTLLSKISR